MSVDLQSAFRFWHLEENAFVRVVCPGPLLLFAGAKREENPGADDICPNMGSFFLFPLPPPSPGPSEARGFYHSRELLAPPSAWPDHRKGHSAACVLTSGPVALESDFFFRGKIFMTENSTKNMRILIMVLRDARGESPDIPKYRLYSIFPKRRIASTKDEQP